MQVAEAEMLRIHATPRLAPFSIFNPTLGNAAGFFLVAGANLDNNIYRSCSAKINIEVVNNEEYTVFRRFLAFIRQKYIIRKGLKKIIFLQLRFNINKIRLISSLTETGIAKKRFPCCDWLDSVGT